MNFTPTQHRDPVCGMAVDPSTAKYSYSHEGITRYFCADNCRQQFIAHSDQYINKNHTDTNTVVRRKASWLRETLVWSSVFAAVVIVVIAARGFAKKAVSVEPGTRVVGAAAGSHRAIDGGQGGVIAEATHEQKADDLEFTVSLNTHTVDLTNFDPSTEIRLQAAGQEYKPKTAVSAGERSSHHQNYRLSFAPVDDTNVVVVVRDVGGIEQRELPLRL